MAKNNEKKQRNYAALAILNKILSTHESLNKGDQTLFHIATVFYRNDYFATKEKVERLTSYAATNY